MPKRERQAKEGQGVGGHGHGHMGGHGRAWVGMGEHRRAWHRCAWAGEAWAEERMGKVAGTVRDRQGKQQGDGRCGMAAGGA